MKLERGFMFEVQKDKTYKLTNEANKHYRTYLRPRDCNCSVIRHVIGIDNWG